MATSTRANASSAANISPVGPPPAITTACLVMADDAAARPGPYGKAPASGILRVATSEKKPRCSSRLTSRMERQTDRPSVYTGTPWEPKVAYCRAKRIGTTIVVSGTVAADASGATVAPGDMYGQ